MGPLEPVGGVRNMKETMYPSDHMFLWARLAAKTAAHISEDVHIGTDGDSGVIVDGKGRADGRSSENVQENHSDNVDRASRHRGK